MLDCSVKKNILGQVSVQLEMTNHDWMKLKTTGTKEEWTWMDQSRECVENGD